MTAFEFELPRDVTRVWDLPVPIIVDDKESTIHAYVTGTIDEPFNYNEICFRLKHASKNSIVNLYINTPGGIIDSAFMVANAIQQCKAKVVGKLSGTVASAGTILAMACDEIEAAPHLSFMIHNYSGSIQGKGNEMKARQKFTDDHLNTAFKAFYEGFLSEEEMNHVIEGTDMWMGSEEVIERWEERVTTLKGTI